jgi:hypothetical protein
MQFLHQQKLPADWWACTKDGRKLGVEKGTAQKLNSLKNIYHFLFVILVV